MADLLSSGEINGAIMKLLQDKAVKKKIKEQYGVDVDGVQSQAEMDVAAENMVETLLRHMSQDVGDSLHAIDRNAIIVSKPKRVGKDGMYKIDISFNTAVLHRDSLYKEKYPNGIDDIVSLFVHGYNASNPVYGQWHGSRVRSRTNRAPNSFMQNAINEFNATNSDKNVVAYIGDDYK